MCENSAEGIFSAIYRAYEEGYPHEHNEVVIDTEGRNMELFCEYHTVVTNFEHAVKVARTIRRKTSEEAYDLFIAAASLMKRRRRMLFTGLCRKDFGWEGRL